MRRSTLAAAAILALLAGYIYWFEREPVSDAEGEEVFEVEADSMDRIEIRRASDAEPILVEREGEKGWRLVSPVAARGGRGRSRPSSPEPFDDAFRTGRGSGFFGEAVGLRARSSRRPKSASSTKEGADRSLAFGSDTPTPSNQYARRDGAEDILVVASHLSLNFDKSAWDLRDKAVFALEDAPEANRMEIERPAGKLVLQKEGGLWFVAEPRSRADRNRAVSIASRVRSAEMKEIVSETQGDLAAFGSTLRRVESASSSKLTARSSSRSERARSPTSTRGLPSRDQVFVLASDLVEELDTALDEIQSKKLFDYAVFGVKKVRIEEKGQPPRELALQDSNEDKKWRETEPAPGRDVDTSKVEDLLYALNGANGTLATPTTAEPDLTITVWSGDPTIEEKVLVEKARRRSGGAARGTKRRP